MFRPLRALFCLVALFSCASLSAGTWSIFDTLSGTTNTGSQTVDATTPTKLAQQFEVHKGAILSDIYILASSTAANKTIDVTIYTDAADDPNAISTVLSNNLTIDSAVAKIYAISGLSTSLNSGTYWIVLDDASGDDVFWYQNTGETEDANPHDFNGAWNDLGAVNPFALQINMQITPEPSTWIAIGGLVGLLCFRERRRLRSLYERLTARAAA